MHFCVPIANTRGIVIVHVRVICHIGCQVITLLALRLACLSNVKVVFWHVFDDHNLQVSVLGGLLVT